MVARAVVVRKERVQFPPFALLNAGVKPVVLGDKSPAVTNPSLFSELEDLQKGSLFPVDSGVLTSEETLLNNKNLDILRGNYYEN